MRRPATAGLQRCSATPSVDACARCADAERVVDVEVAELGERARQALVVRLFAAEKARVLEQQDLAVCQVVRRLDALRRCRCSRRTRPCVPAAARRAARATGSQRILRLRLALRPAEVRQQDDARAAIEQELDRRQRRADARVVGDVPVVVERDVEVDAHERALAA